jgi:rhamnogalacturonyl hydrolase YesR
MADIFYADYTAKFASQDNAAWDDILKQFQLVEKHLRVAENAFPGGAASGLLYHGYDASLTAVWSIPPEGHCPEVWSRAVGWYAMALVDVLDVFPKSHRGHKELRDYLRRLATQIAEAVDPTTGAWWLVMGYPNRPGNYIESSSSAMFIYTLLRGVRLDYLPNRRYIQIASKAYEYLANTFVVPETNGLAPVLFCVVVILTINWQYLVLERNCIRRLAWLQRHLPGMSYLAHYMRVLTVDSSTMFRSPWP